MTWKMKQLPVIAGVICAVLLASAGCATTLAAEDEADAATAATRQEWDNGDAPFALEMVVNETQMDFTLDELEQTPYYIEGFGGYTTSAGTYYEQYYGGIRLARFIESFVPLTEDQTITLVAMDGYAMSYKAGELMDTKEGTWILAFNAYGNRLPRDPGYIRGIKISEEGSGVPVPNIHGHSSPRMIQRIEITAEMFRDFTLTITGKMNHELDRATIQSGIMCTAHRTTVTYEDSRSGTLTSYTGIPLYLMLAYSDHPLYAPHRQADYTIESYNREAALQGYLVEVIAADGFSVTLDSRELDGNNGVILAMYIEDEELGERDWPLRLVWDKDADPVPEGIRAVRNVKEIKLIF